VRSVGVGVHCEIRAHIHILFIIIIITIIGADLLAQPGGDGSAGGRAAHASALVRRTSRATEIRGDAPQSSWTSWQHAARLLVLPSWTSWQHAARLLVLPSTDSAAWRGGPREPAPRIPSEPG
jgi:hypothetical protein